MIFKYMINDLGMRKQTVHTITTTYIREGCSVPVDVLSKYLKITHPALTMQQYINGHHFYDGWQLRASEEFSVEMIQWLPDFAMGIFMYGERTNRCSFIASRAGCYKPVLINEAGLLTEDDPRTEKGGEKAAYDAKVMNFLIEKYYHHAGEPIKPYLNPTTMEELIPRGLLPLYSIRILRFMWNLLSAEEKAPYKLDVLVPTQIAEIPLPITYRAIEVGNNTIENWMQLASVRNNKYAREATEKLIKFGLVDVKNLPSIAGRGRPQAGFAINEYGRRFYVNYLNRFNQQQKWRDRADEKAAENKYNAIEARRSELDALPIESLVSPTKRYIWGSMSPEPLVQDQQAVDDAKLSDSSAFEPKKERKSEAVDSSDIDPVTGENLRDLFGG